MRIFNYIHPEFPKNRNAFKMAVDLGFVVTILNNGGTWILSMEDGEKISIDSEGLGLFAEFVNDCREAKQNRYKK